MGAIFFLAYKSGNIYGDRMQLIEDDYTMRDFFDWCNDRRAEIEKKYGQNATITNIKIL